MTVEEHLDVLVVGAGLSGIAAGHYLQERCPGKRYAILEGRAALGGTWDLFRYPGVRSDSDMYTLGYSFRPWRSDESIAAGDRILDYLKATARDEGIDAHIRYQHRVVRADWSSEQARWRVTLAVGEAGEPRVMTCSFLLLCTGYYAYDRGYTPPLPGLDRYGGSLVHPQAWPEDLDYRGKRVVVIGSGATAMTLVPAMAEGGAHVTMLQRSPTYVVSRPAADPIARSLRRVLPAAAAHRLVRWKNVLLGIYFFQLAKWRPDQVKERLIDEVRAALGSDFDVDTHFTPRYRPWDQRVCLVPDGDLFEAIRDGRVSVVTDQVEAVVPDGIRLGSGELLPADVIVLATGLRLVPLGGLTVSVDGRQVAAGETVYYRGMMLSGVPNLAVVAGYTNASWTLRCELTCAHLCRLLNHMDAHGHVRCEPAAWDPAEPVSPWIDFSSGYVARGIDAFPKQGRQDPWRFHQNYITDLLSMRLGGVDDGTVRFS